MKNVLATLSALLLIVPVVLLANSEELQTDKQFRIHGGQITMKGGPGNNSISINRFIIFSLQGRPGTVTVRAFCYSGTVF